MKTYHGLELPAEQQRAFRKARWLEWLTIVYLVSAITLVYLVLGSSQAMKAAWAEDIISLVPPIAFLVAARFHGRPPTERFSYGYNRAVSIAHVCAALALLVMGAYLLIDSALKLFLAEHPTIGTIELFGRNIWLGWLMLGALLYSGVPPVLLGHLKMPVSQTLHNKVLYADADMNKADWLTAFGAMLGVVGIGFGLWWADSVAAALISLDILKDGYTNLRNAIGDLMDQTPTTVDHSTQDPLRDKLVARLRQLDWVDDVEVRLREEGQVYFGEAFVATSDETKLVEKLGRAAEYAEDLDWRLQDMIITAVHTLPRDQGRKGLDP